MMLFLFTFMQEILFANIFKSKVLINVILVKKNGLKVVYSYNSLEVTKRYSLIAFSSIMVIIRLSVEHLFLYPK